MDMIDIDVINMAAALALTLGVTELIKRVLRTWVADASKFAPLIAIVSAAIVVGALIEVTAATQQDYVLAVIAVTLSAVGIHSGAKNVAAGVQRRAARRA